MARRRRSQEKTFADVFREIAITAIFAFGSLGLLWLANRTGLIDSAVQWVLEPMKPTGPTNAGVLYEQEMAKRAAE